MGNYPGSGKGAIQTAMFALWAAVFTLPRLFTARDSNLLGIRLGKIITIAIYSVVSTFAVMNSSAQLKLPVQAIFMSAYGIILNFQLVPYLSRNGFSKRTLYFFGSALALAAIMNIILFW
jgi:hypothetical protein